MKNKSNSERIASMQVKNLAEFFVNRLNIKCPENRLRMRNELCDDFEKANKMFAPHAGTGKKPLTAHLFVGSLD